jgi:hypothetical protein
VENVGSELNNNRFLELHLPALKFIIPAKNGHPCFLVDGQKRYRRLIDILVNSFSVSSARWDSHWELYHGTGLDRADHRRNPHWRSGEDIGNKKISNFEDTTSESNAKVNANAMSLSSIQ